MLTKLKSAFSQLWTSFQVRLEQTGSWLLVCVLIAAFVAVVALIMAKVKKRELAVILTAAGSLLCAIPLVSTVNLLTEAKAKSLAISEKKAELKSLELQIENQSLKKINLEQENERLNQSVTIANLANEIDLLKNAQLSMNTLNEICELALIETELKQTDVRKELLGTQEGMGLLADRIDSEILVITTHDINAKYGVDLKTVTIREDSDGVLHISGVRPKYIGSSKNIFDPKLSEIRKVEYNKSKNNELTQSKVTVMNDRQSIQLANEKANEFEKEFQNRLSLGQETAFLDDAVVKLAQNFIKVTLAPLNQKIAFGGEEVSGVPILDYLNGKIKDKQTEMDSIGRSGAGE
ncbi:MAG: hypothetical protein J1D88_08875 [Treponema sp.]|nr:hypothetical protein [Treponema sp.]